MSKSLFASFSSEKEDSSFFRFRPPRLIQALLNDPGAPVALLTAEGRIHQTGDAYRALAGPGATPPLPPEATARLHDALRDHTPLTLITDLLAPAGPCPVALTLTHTGLARPAAVLRLTDLRPERALQSRLEQAQRLQAVGQLAAGIAHDFNNLLTAILGGADALAAITPPEAQEDLAQIRRSGERGAALVRQLLAFGRQQTLQPAVLALNDAVRNAATLLQRLLGAPVRLQLELEDPGRMVRIDPTQLDQVLVNLAVNARDAMPQGGQLTIATGRRLLLAPEQDGTETIPPGRYATLEVRDTGAGIPPEVLPHIFEPFYTTRRGAGGTGLGLSTVHGIVRQSGGYLAVTSQPGHGTTFRITLPRHEAQPAAAAPPPPPRPPPATATRRLLLVEDEDPVRRLAARALGRAGWQVIEAASAAEALDADLTGIAQVISDVIMPGMDGPTLVATLRRATPGLPAILISGYADPAQRQALQAQDIAFLAKPFSMAALVALAGAPRAAETAATTDPV